MSERLNDIVVVTGVSASGKDYLLERAKERFPDQVAVFSWGALIHANMRRRFPGVYDASDSLKTATLEDLRASAHGAVDALLECETEAATVLNGHIAYRRQESVVVDVDMNLRLRPRDYIFVEADPEEILHRRISNERDRVIEPVDAIDIHQQLGQAAVAAFASRTGARLNRIYNDDEIERNVNLIAEIVGGE